MSHTDFVPICMLPVPYISQLKSGALMYSNDCGPTAACMLKRALDPSSVITPDGFYKLISAWMSGEPDPMLDHRAIEAGLRALGVETDYSQKLDRGTIFQYLSEKKPIIIGLTYGILVDAGYTQRTGFRGGHWMILNGITLTHYICKDGYRDDGNEQTYIPHNVLEQAMGYVEGSTMSARTGIIPRAGIGQLVDKPNQFLYKVKPLLQKSVYSIPKLPIAGQELLYWIRYVSPADTLFVLDDSNPNFYRIGENEFVVKSNCRRLP